MNYDYGYFNPEPVTSSSLNGTAVWMIVSIVVAIIGGVVAYFTFIKPELKEKDGKVNKYLLWLKDFFSFKTMLIEDLLKVLYLILAIYITFISFTYIRYSFLAFVAVLILGNLILRLIFEGSLVLIMIWKNTNDINKKMKK